MSTDPSPADAPQSLADDAAPVPATDLPVVGIGASAGGLAALQVFFRHMPADSGMAFVVILHLSPQYESQLAELLQRTTAMSVRQVTETVALAPNHVYVIPPAQHLTMVDGTIQLSAPVEPRAPIDLFFRSLAETHGPRAAAVVLSGTGADGTMGAQRVKERGGVVLAQDPAEAEYDSMPRSAIATGLVDYVLPVAELPATLVAYWRHTTALALPERDPDDRDLDVASLRTVLDILRARTGHDFSQYKRPTLLRRIARRLQVTGATDLRAYLTLLRTRPDECAALLRDLLISVTNFFRDPGAWHALEDLIPRLFSGKGSGDVVRAWVAGCATGEEAYSLAIILSEYALTLDARPAINVFATDIDEHAIAHARQGLYPDTIVVDVAPARLQRYFTSEPGHYRVRKEIRDMVLFASHNLLRDPPFIKLDLITCRNLLIYIDRAMQEQILQLFHFSLRPEGLLLLGSSEATDGVPSLFTPVDKAQRLFQRRTAPSAAPLVPAIPLVSSLRRQSAVEAPGDALPPSFDDLASRALAQHGPPGVIVNEDYDIVHLARGAGRFLQFTDGTLSPNLLKALHPELRLELRTALYRAMQDGQPAETRRVALGLGGAARQVSATVYQLAEPAWARGYLLILFYDLPDSGDSGPGRADDAEPLVRQIEEELQRTKAQLRALTEQYDTVIEEHKAGNEELQAINEELRATTEELETSKEELQAINEELLTVNQELKHKIEELSHANSDLQNLIVSTAIGTIFVDRELRIKRYTPSAQTIVNLLPGDLNRPLSHITNRLAYDELIADATHVLSSLMPVERTVASHDGRWYLLRIQPYRTEQDHIDGVVLTFVDITLRWQAEEALRTSEERLRLLIDSVQDYAILTVTPDNRVAYWNSGAERLFGYREAEILGHDAAELFTSEDRAAGVPAQEQQQALKAGRAEDERWHLRKDGARFFASGVITPMRDSTVRGFAKVMRDLTDRKHAEEELRRAHGDLELRVQQRTQALADMNAQLQTEVEQRAMAERERRAALQQLVTAQEAERQRIARELHDQLGQQLVALRLSIAALTEPLRDPAQAEEHIRGLQQRLTQIDVDVERIALELRPSVLDNLGVVATLQQHVDDWVAHHHISAEFATTGATERRLAPEIEIVLYRVAQEALTNVIKHSDAQHVSVILKQQADQVQMIVEDDGKGFIYEEGSQAAYQQHGLGMRGMRERVELVGGTLTVESTPGHGTTIFVLIPLRSAPQEGT